MKLTPPQELMLYNLEEGKAIYVFSRKGGKLTFSYKRETGELYTSLTASSLLRKEKVRVVPQVDTTEAQFDYVGVLRAI